MRTVIFLPPLGHMSGGLRVLLRLGGMLHRHGFDVSFVARSAAPWLEAGGEAEKAAPQVPVYWWRDQEPDMPPLEADDIWLVPEGWPHALLPGMKAGARVVVYVQNWAYLLAQWPENLAPDALPVHYLAVSHPVAWYVRKITGKNAPVLPAGIDPGVFFPPEEGKDRVGSFTGKPRVGWMPRKNKAQARHIREIVDASRATRRLEAVEWVEIHNMTLTQVADSLRSCWAYLATGFPEGFSLPPLEAMACGCLGVGVAGFGGFEYMRLPNPEGFDAPGLLPAWLPPEFTGVEGLPERPGNGFWVSDGDILGAALAVERALDLFVDVGSATLQGLLAGGRATAGLYTLDASECKALELWNAARNRDIFA